MKKFDKYNKAKVPWRKLPDDVRMEIYRAQDRDYWNPISKRWDENCVVSFSAHCIYRVRPPKKVYVHVRGGVAYCDRVPKGVEVKIIDHDNQGG